MKIRGWAHKGEKSLCNTNMRLVFRKLKTFMNPHLEPKSQFKSCLNDDDDDDVGDDNDNDDDDDDDDDDECFIAIESNYNFQLQSE